MPVRRGGCRVGFAAVFSYLAEVERCRVVEVDSGRNFGSNEAIDPLDLRYAICPITSPDRRCAFADSVSSHAAFVCGATGAESPVLSIFEPSSRGRAVKPAAFPGVPCFEGVSVLGADESRTDAFVISPRQPSSSGIFYDLRLP